MSILALIDCSKLKSIPKCHSLHVRIISISVVTICYDMLKSYESYAMALAIAINMTRLPSIWARSAREEARSPPDPGPASHLAAVRQSTHRQRQPSRTPSRSRGRLPDRWCRTCCPQSNAVRPS